MDKKFPVLRRDNTSAKGIELVEIQANRFAAEITVPRILLLSAIGNDVIDIDDSELVTDLAKEFKVSADAMKVRISNLFGSL